MLFEERQRVVVQDLNGGDRHLRRVEPSPDEAAEAVEHGLDVDLADALQRVPAKKVSTATGSAVASTWMCRSRYLGSKRSNAWICSSVRKHYGPSSAKNSATAGDAARVEFLIPSSYRSRKRRSESGPEPKTSL